MGRRKSGHHYKVETSVQRVLENIFREMDKEERRKIPKNPQVKGPRIRFLEKYKVEGYDKAKDEINKPFGEREVYNDKILKEWIEQENV